MNVLSDVFHQAGVSFTLEGSSGVKDLAYDSQAIVYDGNGIPISWAPDPKTTPGMDGRLSPSEESSLWGRLDFKQACPHRFIEDESLGIVFFKNSGYVYDNQRTFWVRGVAGGPVFLANSPGYADLAAAHEIGHQLGISMEDGGSGKHDVAPYPPGVVGDNPDNVLPSVPSNPPNLHLPIPGYAIMLDGAPVLDLDGTYKLPWLHGRWMKHEDWEEANKNAKVLPQ